MRLRTINGYDFGEVSSAMQKACRRGNATLAGYWAHELFASGYGNYVWKRLLTVSAEDCWGILTQEIVALHYGYDHVNKGVPAREAKGRIFISKAVILICQAKKSRDADHLQNYVYDQGLEVTAKTLADSLRESDEYVSIPDYAYDCHTQAGRRRGATKGKFFRDEQEALCPKQLGLFDHLVPSDCGKKVFPNKAKR